MDNSCDERFKEEYGRLVKKIKTAKLTGKPQLVNKWIASNGEVSCNTVTVLAMPDGTLETYDSNDENVKIPEYEE